MIEYFFEDVQEIIIPDGFEPWVKQTIQKDYTITYIFCNNNKILEINKNYLSHNYYTDIITFDLSDSDSNLEADIFISLDMVKSNSEKFGHTFVEELVRVMCHGILHLTGFNDKTILEQKEMSRAENIAIQKILS